jgi:hypothetical protein
MTRDDAPALLRNLDAFLSALVPMSAGADLFGRSLSLSFGPGIAGISVPSLAIPSADFVKEGEAFPVVQASPVTAATLHPLGHGGARSRCAVALRLTWTTIPTVGVLKE